MQVVENEVKNSISCKKYTWKYELFMEQTKIQQWNF